MHTRNVSVSWNESKYGWMVEWLAGWRSFVRSFCFGVVDYYGIELSGVENQQQQQQYQLLLHS